jgi:hypothetical protein
MKIENLRSLIRESVQEYIKEIDQAANEAAMDARITKCEEAINMRESKLEKLRTLEEVSDVLDEAKVKNIEKEINELKKAKAKFEKQKEKMLNKGKKKEVVADTETEAAVEEADVTAEMDMGDDVKEEAINESFLKMQKLAGVITESEYNQKKSLIENRINYDTFRWKKAPANPNNKLIDYDEDKEITKASFWETDITNRSVEYTIPNYAQEENGKWRFQWDSGDMGGFVEGEDFTF